MDSKNTDPLTVYGADWCGDTKRTRQLLDEAGVAYTYINADDDTAAEEKIAAWNNGRAIYPTLDMGGTIAVNPPPAKLAELLQNHGYTAA